MTKITVSKITENDIGYYAILKNWKIWAFNSFTDQTLLNPMSEEMQMKEFGL